jgi:hypothetical protein
MRKSCLFGAAAAFSLFFAFMPAANAQLPNFNNLTEACKALYNNYIAAYNAYVDYYVYLHGLYPNGNNPPNTGLVLQQKIDAMYKAQDAFQGTCGSIDAFGRGSKAPRPDKINLKHGKKK